MKFLVVGCGGSGGVTLQFLMDQLRADLARLGFPPVLPRGWQFVHIDAPLTPDGIGAGRPPLVPQQGGTYVALTTQGASYRSTYDNLVGTLRTTPGAVRAVSPWIPDPRVCTVPVTKGAGQFRAVGRTLTLPQALEIGAALRRAYGQLGAAGVDAELMALHRAIAPGAEPTLDPEVLVLVVSSMAGGAGASMVLDVCRLLSGLSPSIAGSTALFVYTPEIFQQLPEAERLGIDANGMAMMGELLAAQMGAAPELDAELLHALGWPADPPQVPFRRVLPIGARVGGDGAAFGDGSLDGIYRATGRGLAGLMLSRSALQDFRQYDLTNDSAVRTDTRSFGWGADLQGSTQWGSFGFASLGLGRERYGEYAAQRLAREAVDRLAAGHLSAGDDRTGAEQLAARVESRWALFRDRVLLPSGSGSRDLWEGWVTRVARSDIAQPAMHSLVDRVLGPRLSFTGPYTVGDFVQSWPSVVGNNRAQLLDEVQAEAYRLVFEWHVAFRAALEDAVVAETAANGLATARGLLTRAAEEIPHVVSLLRELARNAGDPTAPEPSSWQALVAQDGRHQLTADHPLLQNLRVGHENVLVLGVQLRAAGMLADVLQSARDELLLPFGERIRDLLAQLEAARDAAVADTGLARVQTDEYRAWPTGQGEVPRRFAAAHNEVLLTSADAFEDRFRSDLEATPSGGFGDPLRRAVDELLRGEWEDDGAPAAVPVLARTATWRPAALAYNPGDRTTAYPQQRADYRLAFTAPDVLGRARLWLGRPEQPFSRFIGQSLHTYLTEPGIGPAELEERARRLLVRFRETLALARPLVAVNAQTYAMVHSGNLLQHVKFSEVPFQGLPVAGEMERILTQDAGVDPASVTRLQNALVSGPSSRATRIDVFGSYPPLSPLAFTSLLAPIVERWSALRQPQARGEFWHWRRSRRLPGALPLTRPGRRALIGGFFVGRATGLIRLPGEAYARGAEIFDVDERTWRRFPDPMLTPPERERHPLDALPALLESILIAMVECYQSPQLEPLLPFRLMRELYDDSEGAPFSAWDKSRMAAARHLQRWVTEGISPSGTTPDRRYGPSAQDGATPADRSAGATARKRALEAYFAGVVAGTGADWLAPGEHGAPGGGEFSNVDRRDPWAVPMYSEVAADVYDVARELAARVAELRTDERDVDREPGFVL